MGSCVSLHRDREAALKLRLSFGSNKDKLVNPSPEKQSIPAAGDAVLKSQWSPAPAQTQFGSKEETFFDSQAWLESDCDDDFLSVNGGGALAGGVALGAGVVAGVVAGADVAKADVAKADVAEADVAEWLFELSRVKIRTSKPTRKIFSFLEKHKDINSSSFLDHLRTKEVNLSTFLTEIEMAPKAAKEVIYKMKLLPSPKLLSSYNVNESNVLFLYMVTEMARYVGLQLPDKMKRKKNFFSASSKDLKELRSGAGNLLNKLLQSGYLDD